jgi:hypothetical protein
MYVSIVFGIGMALFHRSLSVSFSTLPAAVFMGGFLPLQPWDWSP